jgi:hypothetical protein
VSILTKNYKKSEQQLANYVLLHAKLEIGGGGGGAILNFC